jgi:hypothetical protein
MKETTHDDGNWNWKYECIYVIPTQDPKDWVYEIAFSTNKGGYLNGGAITCHYYDTINILSISRGNGKLNFYVDNFDDMEKILSPMIKAHEAVIYPLFESKIAKTKKERRKKLKKINKKIL